MNTNEQRYVEAFTQWMTDWKPDAFVTINLPKVTRAPRPESFYLTQWTVAAESDLLGPRTRKIADFDRRIVWLFRREVSPDNLIHYHAVVKFPIDRPWRDEYRYDQKIKGVTTDVSFKQRMSERGFESVITRCRRLEQALRIASSRTPEPFTRKNEYQPSVADIDVRPYDVERNHAGYLLKGMRRFSLPHDRTEFSSDDLLRDSGLIVLPHLPGKKPVTTSTRRTPPRKEPHR
jgi:hypothetical protein